MNGNLVNKRVGAINNEITALMRKVSRIDTTGFSRLTYALALARGGKVLIDTARRIVDKRHAGNFGLESAILKSAIALIDADIRDDEIRNEGRKA